MQSEGLGLWSHDALDQTVSASTGSRYNAERPELLQFVHSVAKILLLRRARSPATLDAKPSIFILGKPPAQAKREPLFNGGGVEVAGSVWFGAESMSSARGIALPEGDADEVFRYVVETLDAGTQPAVYFDSSTGTESMRLYPQGLGEDETCDVITISGAKLTVQELKDVLDRAHAHNLVTPMASENAKALWANPKKWHPAERSESVVQAILENALSLAWAAIRVKREHSGVSGRYDLGLSEQDPMDPTVSRQHALLELKVVKSFTHTGNKVAERDNKKAVSKGLRQASSYRNEHGFRLSALCCYDMKKPHSFEECFEHEVAAAAKKDVQLWVWPLFPTPEAFRDRDFAASS